MEMSPAQLKSIHLYRSLLRVVAAWPETAGASFRIPLLRRIMQEFRKNKNETDPSKISQLQAAGEVQLSAARRLLDNAYKTKVRETDDCLCLEIPFFSLPLGVR